MYCIDMHMVVPAWSCCRYMQSINWILENDISEAGLDLNFSTEHNSFGKTEHVELLPGGADIPVTDENKHG